MTEKELEKLLAKGHCKLSAGQNVTLNAAAALAGTQRTKSGGGKRSKSGYRADLQAYFRSSWEANYARYLNWLEARGQISNWEYETEEFDLFRIVRKKRVEYRRGNRFYRIDFKITNTDQTVEYHEIKGYLDKTSRTKLKRFARCYPLLTIKIIGAEAYYSVQNQFRNSITGWE